MTAMSGMIGEVASRSNANNEQSARMTGESVWIAESLSGQYAERNIRRDVFWFTVAAVTVPVNANNLVSVCGIYNPPGSNKMVEIIDSAAMPATATTVVQTFVWVSSTAAASAAATFTTLGTARSRVMQDTTSSAVRVYTAVTHSGTPNVEAFVGGYTKVTSDLPPAICKFDGTLMIPPGILASLCTLTAASASASTNLGFTWAETPYQA